MYTIYIHKNKLNDKVYVGQTLKEPTRRWDNGNGYKKQPKFFNAILKYGWDNFEHNIIKTNLSKEEADRLEIELIKKYDSIANGYNVSPGGDGEQASVLSKEVIQYNLDGEEIARYPSQSAAARAVGAAQANISAACLGKKTIIKGYIWSLASNPLTKEQVLQKIKSKEENMSKGRVAPKKNQRPVVMVDLETHNIINTYQSMSEASRQTGISMGRIQQECSQDAPKSRHPRPFIMQYADDNHF